MPADSRLATLSAGRATSTASTLRHGIDILMRDGGIFLVAADCPARRLSRAA